MSYVRRLKRGLLGTRGCVRVSRGIRGLGGWEFASVSCLSGFLSPCRVVWWPLHIRLLLEPRLCQGPIGLDPMMLFLLNRRRGCLFLYLSALVFVFGISPISCI